MRSIGGTLPKKERAICKRLKEARVHLGLTQQQVADAVHITRSKLASYETMRQPVRHCFALFFSLHYGIDLGWLATGSGAMVPAKEIPIKRSAVVPIRMRLSTAYSQFYLKQGMPGTAASHRHEASKAEVEKSRKLIDSLAKYWAKTIRDNEVVEFAEYIMRATADFKAQKEKNPDFASLIDASHADPT